MSTPLLNTKPLETFDPRQYQVPEQPAPPGYIKTLEEQAKRHEEEYGQALADWRKTYDDTVAEKANLYKADPKYAEAKRKEAAIKTLVGAFGSLADTFAVANGGTAPLRDHRADIYQTRQQADALDQNERAKEASAYQKYLDRLEKLADKRPKWAKNDAAIQLAGIYADNDRWTLNAALQRELQGDRLKAQAEEGEKGRKAAAARTQARINAGKEEDPEKINNPLNNGEIWLDKNFLNKTNISQIVQQIIDKYHVTPNELWRIKEETKAKLSELLESGEISISEYHRLYQEASNTNKYTESDLGRLLQMYPDAANILMEHDLRGGEYTKPITTKKETPYSRPGVRNFKTKIPPVLTDPQGNTAKKVFE
jgi:hypothetical protein